MVKSSFLLEDTSIRICLGEPGLLCRLVCQLYLSGESIAFGDHFLARDKLIFEELGGLKTIALVAAGDEFSEISSKQVLLGKNDSNILCLFEA